MIECRRCKFFVQLAWLAMIVRCSSQLCSSESLSRSPNATMTLSASTQSGTLQITDMTIMRLCEDVAQVERIEFAR
jgi:hypothetical protein